jgi:hypothetical protein
VRILEPFVTASLIAVVASGCSPSTGPVDDMTRQQQEYFAELAQTAEANGASELQVATLEEAAATGELTTAMVTNLYEPLFECFATLGGHGEVFGTVEVAPGVVVPDYRIAFEDSVSEAGGQELDTAVTQCQTTHAEFVWQALFLQPKAIEAREREALNVLPQVEECLAEVGVELPPNPSPEHINDAVVRARELGQRCSPEQFTAP